MVSKKGWLEKAGSGVLASMFLLLATVDVSAQTPLANAQAIHNQVMNAYNNGDSSVTIAPGDYEIASNANRILEFNNLQNFTINAVGVNLIATELKQVLNFSNANNLTVNGFTVDYDPLPFTQGTVVTKNSNNSQFTVQLHNGYDLYSGSTKVIAYDTNGNIKPRTATRFGSTATAIGSNQIQVNGGAISDNLAIGDYVTLTRADDIQIPHAVFLDNSSNVTLNQTVVNASTSFAFFERGGDGGNTYNGVQVTPGSTPAGGTQARLLSSNADGIHSKSVSVGPTISQAQVRAQGDDGIAINGSFLPLGQTAANTNTIKVAARSGSSIGTDVRVGDTIQITSSDGTGLTQAVVTAIAADNSLNWSNVRSQFYPQLNTNAGSYNQGFELTLDRTVDVEAGGLVANPDRTGSGFSITDSLVENHRARGMLIKASNGEIRNNTVDGSTIGGIVVVPEPLVWLESDFADSVEITGNTVRDTGKGFPNANAEQVGAITVAGPVDWNGYDHTNILIDNNTIDLAVGTNLVLSDVDGVTVTNNKFITPHRADTTSGTGIGIDSRAVIWTDDAINAVFANNTLENPGIFTEALLRITENTSLTGRFGGITETHDEAVTTVANYRNDFQTGTPASQWSYAWNASGEVGDPNNYADLVYASQGYYSLDGTAVPTADPARFLRVGATFLHTGLSDSQNAFDRYAIIAYEILEAGEYAIRDSLLQTNGDTTGIDMLIHVNGNPSIFEASINPFAVASFDVDLGALQAGDMIYLAFGPGQSPASDFVDLDFSIVKVVPEPATATFIVMAFTALSTRRKSMQKRN